MSPIGPVECGMGQMSKTLGKYVNSTDNFEIRHPAERRGPGGSDKEKGAFLASANPDAVAPTELSEHVFGANQVQGIKVGRDKAGL